MIALYVSQPVSAKENELKRYAPFPQAFTVCTMGGQNGILPTPVNLTLCLLLGLMTRLNFIAADFLCFSVRSWNISCCALSEYSNFMELFNDSSKCKASRIFIGMSFTLIFPKGLLQLSAKDTCDVNSARFIQRNGHSYTGHNHNLGLHRC